MKYQLLLTVLKQQQHLAMAISFLEMLTTLNYETQEKLSMSNKWHILLEQLEEVDYNLGSEIWNDKQFQEFESQTGLILPQDYKDFCQIFGTVGLGNYVRIYCPDLAFSNFSIETLKEDITDNYLFLGQKNINIETLEELLNSAFVFADNDVADVFFWDLRTYNSSDQNCDIYMAGTDCFGGDVYKIGQNFYEFVQNFCLGTKAYEVLPESIQPDLESIRPTYSRFKPVY